MIADSIENLIAGHRSDNGGQGPAKEHTGDDVAAHVPTSFFFGILFFIYNYLFVFTR